MIVVDYFTKLFASNGGGNMNEVLANVTPRVTTEMNLELMQSVTDEEVKTAIFQMHPTKAPGLDGMTPGIYQKHWGFVGMDVCNGVRSLMQSGQMPRKVM